MGKWALLIMIALTGGACSQGTGLERTSSEEHEPIANVLHQGNSKEDLQITTEIRKSIVVEPGKDEHSVAAKNIQIVTRGGEVRLSGKVRSETEREDLGKRAEEVAGENRVDNQLVVEPEKP